ncbi:Hypp3727 [Branchiostoma lanceolatum]|uniref:Hypp3727 protein n=1 Tax=Branchiostoma lanceolatum TaxID=7740 RepID=A0A8K0EUW6_BRALA|nr:Hypp3727 [Branchiostoma lanceolatum]
MQGPPVNSPVFEEEKAQGLQSKELLREQFKACRARNSCVSPCLDLKRRAGYNLQPGQLSREDNTPMLNREEE